MLVIKKNQINELIQKLAKKTAVISPVKRKDGEHVFKEFEIGDKIDLKYITTILSAKDFFLPAKEETFVFSNKKCKILPTGKKQSFILFGLNLRDTEALVQLDEIMKKPQPDYFYFQKRKAATIVGITGEEGAAPTTGIDLILKKIGPNEYEATELSAKGKKITKNKLFKHKSKSQLYETRFHKSKVMPQLQNLLLDAELLHDAVKWSWQNMTDLWEKLGKQCITCGICTYVCPLCYCFSVEDRCSLNGQTCTKSRYWTACTLPEFARITGGLPAGRQGHNFHRTIKERYYNWYYHKFVRAYTEYGKSQCVACGRCAKDCPAGINIEEVLIDIVKKYKININF